MVIAALAVLIGKCLLAAEHHNFDSLVHRVAVDGFHIVVFGLRNIDAREPRCFGKLLNVVVALAAKMQGAPYP